MEDNNTATPTTETNMKTIADNVPSNPNFPITREIVTFGDCNWRAVCTVSDDARRWDGMPADVTHALFSELHGVWCPCEIVVAPNAKRRFDGGAACITARVRFWNDGEGFGEWNSATLFEAR